MNCLVPSLRWAQVSLVASLFVLLGAGSADAQFHGGAIFNDPFGPNGSTLVGVGDRVTNRVALMNFDECNDSLEVNKIVFSVEHQSGTRFYTNNYSPPLVLRQHVAVSAVEGYFETSFPWTVLPGDELLPGGILKQNASWYGVDRRNSLPGDPNIVQVCPQGVPDSFLLTFPNQVTVRTTVQPPPTNLCVLQAVSDKWNKGGSSHAVWMPGIYTDFIFTPQYGAWSSNADHATLNGIIRRRDDLSSGFEISVVLSNKTTIPGPDSPRLDLDPDAYIWNGGPIDPSTWCYYEDFSGVFTGFGRYQGAVMDIIRHGPAWQLGVGANNKNGNFGAAAWFTWSLRQPFGSLPMSGVGDFNIDIFQCVPAVLGDLVWFDANQNGQQDGGVVEVGMPDVQIQLLSCSGTLVLLSQTSSSSGGYLFTNLQAGSYRIQVVLPPNTAITPAVNVGNDATDSDVDPITHRSGCVTLSNTVTGSTNRTVDVGIIAAGPAPAPRLLAVKPLPWGETLLKIEGARLRNYLIESTDNPNHGWEPAGTAWNVDGTLKFIDSMQLPSCLYRVKLLP